MLLTPTNTRWSWCLYLYDPPLSRNFLYIEVASSHTFTGEKLLNEKHMEYENILILKEEVPSAWGKSQYLYKGIYLNLSAPNIYGWLIGWTVAMCDGNRVMQGIDMKISFEYFLRTNIENIYHSGNEHTLIVQIMIHTTNRVTLLLRIRTYLSLLELGDHDYLS